MATSKTSSKAPAKKAVSRTATAAPDKKPPAAAPKAVAAPKTPAPVHYKTTSGFEVDISPIVWDDMEVLDLFVELSSGDDVSASMAVPRVLRKIFTPEQKQAFYDHIRTPDGRVPLEAVSSELMALINAIGGAGKN